MTLLPRALLLLLPLLAASCAGPASPERRASAAERAACRQRAEDMDRTRDPGAVYRADAYASSTRDAPFAGAGVPGANDALAALYRRRQQVDSCLNSGSLNSGSLNPGSMNGGSGSTP